MRTVVSTTPPGRRLLSAGCVVCGYTFAALTNDPDATVDHRCPTQGAGPTWILIEPAGRLPYTGRKRGGGQPKLTTPQAQQ